MIAVRTVLDGKSVRGAHPTEPNIETPISVLKPNSLESIHA